MSDPLDTVAKNAYTDLSAYLREQVDPHAGWGASDVQSSCVLIPNTDRYRLQVTMPKLKGWEFVAELPPAALASLDDDYLEFRERVAATAIRAIDRGKGDKVPKFHPQDQVLLATDVELIPEEVRGKFGLAGRPFYSGDPNSDEVFDAGANYYVKVPERKRIYPLHESWLKPGFKAGLPSGPDQPP